MTKRNKLKYFDDIKEKRNKLKYLILRRRGTSRGISMTLRRKWTDIHTKLFPVKCKTSFNRMYPITSKGHYCVEVEYTILCTSWE